ncbi:hypothetical protein [Companilactobacillus zhongbaensis]|nr:hypothetical protein [Companilactobacillus zhongbaensis]
MDRNKGKKEFWKTLIISLVFVILLFSLLEMGDVLIQKIPSGVTTSSEVI